MKKWRVALRNFLDTRDHGSLAGLSDDDHPIYAHKEVFYPVQGTDSRGDYAGVILQTGGDTGHVSGYFPSDMNSISEIVLVIIPFGSKSSNNLAINVDYASSGEAYNTHTDGMTFVGATTANQITEIDISGLFDNASGGDYFGVSITDNNAGLGNDLLLLGVRLKWT